MTIIADWKIYSLVWLIILSLSGCRNVHIHRPDGADMVMSQDEFAKYTEAVFRHHNRVMSTLIERIDNFAELGKDDSMPVKVAESEMVVRCRPLNDFVDAEMSGSPVSMTSKMVLVNAVPDCEAATLHLESLISRIDQ